MNYSSDNLISKSYHTNIYKCIYRYIYIYKHVNIFINIYMYIHIICNHKVKGRQKAVQVNRSIFFQTKERLKYNPNH